MNTTTNQGLSASRFHLLRTASIGAALSAAAVLIASCSCPAPGYRPSAPTLSAALDDACLCGGATWGHQGPLLQGTSVQFCDDPEKRLPVRSFSLEGMRTRCDDAISNARAQQGKLTGNLPGGATLAPEAFVGAQIKGIVDCANGDPGDVVAFVREVAPYSGSVPGLAGAYTYRVDLYNHRLDTWEPACPDGQVAIPTAEVWSPVGVPTWEPSDPTAPPPTRFTFACLNAAIGDCYGWNYVPWASGASPAMRDLHWACTRMARADYCGTGKSYTRPGTCIDVGDTASPPVNTLSSGGPGASCPGVSVTATFGLEAVWGTNGAQCISHPRHADLVPEECDGKPACSGDVTSLASNLVLNRSVYPISK